jgi:cytochrome c-type biogenesis protein CcmH/NrfG
MANIQDALAAAPNSWEAWDTAGVIAEQQKNFAYAIVCYTKAQKLNPSQRYILKIMDLSKLLNSPTSATRP